MVNYKNLKFSLEVQNMRNADILDNWRLFVEKTEAKILGHCHFKGSDVLYMWCMLTYFKYCSESQYMVVEERIETQQLQPADNSCEFRWWLRARICRSFKENRNRFPAWRAGTKPSFSYWPARLHRLAKSIPRNRFLSSINVYKYGLWILKFILYCITHVKPAFPFPNLTHIKKKKKFAMGFKSNALRPLPSWRRDNI